MFNCPISPRQRSAWHQIDPGVPDDIVPQEALQWRVASHRSEAPTLQPPSRQDHGGQGAGTVILPHKVQVYLSKCDAGIFRTFDRINFVKEGNCWCFSSDLTRKLLAWFSLRITRPKCWQGRKEGRLKRWSGGSWRKRCHPARTWASVKTGCWGCCYSQTPRSRTVDAFTHRCCFTLFISTFEHVFFPLVGSWLNQGSWRWGTQAAGGCPSPTLANSLNTFYKVGATQMWFHMFIQFSSQSFPPR